MLKHRQFGWLRGGSIAALAAVAAALPLPAHADLTIVERTTLEWNGDTHTKRMAKDVVYTSGGKERIDDYRDTTLHISTIYDSVNHVKTVINWLSKVYYVSPWQRRTPSQADRLHVRQQATTSYRTILGHRCRLYIDNGGSIQGRHAAGREWIAQDLPADIKSPVGRKGRALAYETTIGDGAFRATTQAVAVDTKPLPATTFYIPTSLRRVDDASQVYSS